MEPRRRLAAPRGGARSASRGSSGSRSGPGACRPRSPAIAQRPKQRRVVEPEVVDHERLGVGTPASIDRRQLGDRVVLLAARPRATGRQSTADSPSVAARHSRSPGEQRPPAAGAEPVPGLLKARNVVVPPNAAATESWKNRSGSASLATRVWVWTSMTPGSTSRPVASTTSRRRRGRRPATAASIADDPAALDRRRRRDDAMPAAVTTVAAADDEVRPPTRQLRPRRSRSPGRPPRGSAARPRAAAPASRRRGRRVAKWLAASWPTFDDVVHAP